MGTLWHRSGTVERFGDDLRAAGAKAYFFQGGTTTPLTVYRDSNDSSSWPHPVEADANGRWPDIFIPFTLSYDVQVTTAEGVQLTFTLAVSNPDPIDVTVVVPPEERIQTGMIHGEFVDSTKAGYVRLNGRTIGSSASSASERNNDDTLDLYTYLWNNVPDTIAPVSGGRGSSAGSDFAINKTLTLPSMRGVTLAGLDTMGNTGAGAFTGLTFSAGNASTPGSLLGTNTVTLTLSQLPAHTHSGSTTADAGHVHGGVTASENAAHTHNLSIGFTTGGANSSLDHTHNYTDNFFAGANATTAGPNPPGGSNQSQTLTTAGANSGLDHTHSGAVSGATGAQNQNHQHGFTTNLGGAHSHTFTTDSQGGGQAMPNMQITRLVTWFIKL